MVVIENRMELLLQERRIKTKMVETEVELAEEDAGMEQLGLGEENGKGNGKAGRGKKDLASGENIDYSVVKDFGLPTQENKNNKRNNRRNNNRRNNNRGNNSRQKVPEKKRYVDDNPKMPLKTRGFYLKVVMDRNKLPELLVQLTNLKYPVEIVRVHQASLNSSTPKKKVGTATTPGEPMANATSRPSPFDPPMSVTGVPMGIGAARPQNVIQKTSEQEKAEEAYERAFNDPHLSEVVISGLMTIYTPADEDLPGKSKQKK